MECVRQRMKILRVQHHRHLPMGPASLVKQDIFFTKEAATRSLKALAALFAVHKGMPGFVLRARMKTVSSRTPHLLMMPLNSPALRATELRL